MEVLFTRVAIDWLWVMENGINSDGCGNGKQKRIFYRSNICEMI
jgi:hypothetical protein